MKKTVRECLYLEYQGNRLEDRAEELLCMIHNFQCYSVRLEVFSRQETLNYLSLSSSFRFGLNTWEPTGGMGVKILLQRSPV